MPPGAWLPKTSASRGPYGSRTTSKRSSLRGTELGIADPLDAPRWSSSSGPLSCLPDKAISQKKDIDLSPCERFQGIIGHGHERFLVVERRVENERHAREVSKATDQRVEQRILLLIDDLHTAGAILMQNGGDLGRSFGADGIRQNHQV